MKYDTVIEVRVDRRDLATVELLLRKQGYEAKTRSELARIGIESIVETAVQRGEIHRVESTEEALHILSRFGSLNAGKRGKKVLLANLQKEVVVSEGHTAMDEIVRRSLAALEQKVEEEEEPEEKASFDDV